MNLTDELALTLVITGLLFTAFARLRNEDEFTARMRLDALHWAVVINYLLIFAAYIINNQFFASEEDAGIFSFEGWSVLSDLNWIVYALFSPLLIFIARFYYMVMRYKRDRVTTNRIFQLPRIPFRYIGIIGFILSFPVLCALPFEEHYPALGKLLPEILIHTAWYSLPLFLILWVFSKDRVEDEYIRQLRLESWQITFYIHYALTLLLTYSTYGAVYFIVMLLSTHMMPLLFLLIYHFKKLRHEKYD